MLHPLTQWRPLHQEFVEYLFGRLVVRYGRDFLAQWSGIEISVVHKDWAEVLGGQQRIDAAGKLQIPSILWALGQLPDRLPLNAQQFRALCRCYVEPNAGAAQLPAPRPVPNEAQTRLQGILERTKDGRSERVRVAERFIAKWGQPGMKLNPRRRDMLAFYREILASATRSEHADQ